MPISSTEPAVASAPHTSPSPSQLRCATSPKGRGKNVRRLWWRHNTARGTCGTAPYGATPADTPRSHGGSQGFLPPLGGKKPYPWLRHGSLGLRPSGLPPPTLFRATPQKSQTPSQTGLGSKLLFLYLQISLNPQALIISSDSSYPKSIVSALWLSALIVTFPPNLHISSRADLSGYGSL